MNRTNAVALGWLLGSSVGIAAAQETTEAPAAPAEVGTVPVAEAAAPASTEEGEPTAEGRTKSRLIEEIIVTANRREENVKDVPISISAFSPDFLQAKGVMAQQDLPKVTPGLTVGQPVGFATTYIRGVGSDAFILADPLVVTYIDGVYFPASTTQFQEFGDVERIEIDKGPQGTLFGRNALGGVIAITSKSPNLTEVEGSARSGYTSFTGSSSNRGAWTASGFVSIPLITDTLAFSVSALRGQNDPYYPNYVGPDPNHKLVSAGDSNAYRFKVLFQPFDDLKVKLNYYRSFVNDPQRNIGIQTGPSVLGGSIGGVPLFLQPQNPYGRNDINDVPYSDDLTRNLSGAIEGRTPWMDVHLLGARQRILAQRNSDFDGTDVPLAYFEDQDRDGDPYRRPFFSHGDSYELRFLTNDSAPDWFEGVAGLYHYEQDSGVGGANFVGGATDLSLGVIGGVEVPGLEALYNDVLAAIINGLGIPTPTGVNLALRGGIGETSKAAYAQMTFKFTDWMSLTTGARYQETKRTVLFADQAIYVQGSDEPIFIQSNSGEDDPQYRTQSKFFDPKVVLALRPSPGIAGDDPLIYLSYQTASIGSNFNTISLFQAPTKISGSELEAYEVGLKTHFFEVMNFDTAFFYYKQKNPYTQVVSLQSGGAVHFENAQGIETKGWEASLVTPLLPNIDDGLVLTFGTCYLDSTYSSYENASGFNETTGVYSSNYDATGNRVVQTPKWTVSAGLNQTIDFGNGTVDFGVDYYYNDGYFFLAQNSEKSEVPSYQTVGVTASYKYNPWGLRISAFGRNITNEKYLNGRFVNDFGVIDYPAYKSTAGVNVQWDF